MINIIASVAYFLITEVCEPEIIYLYVTLKPV